MQTEPYKIAEAARRLGVHPQTLRAWERQGVVPPAARQRGQRRYSAADLERIRAAVRTTPAGCLQIEGRKE